MCAVFERIDFDSFCLFQLCFCYCCICSSEILFSSSSFTWAYRCVGRLCVCVCVSREFEALFSHRVVGQSNNHDINTIRWYFSLSIAVYWICTNASQMPINNKLNFYYHLIFEFCQMLVKLSGLEPTHTHTSDAQARIGWTKLNKFDWIGVAFRSSGSSCSCFFEVVSFSKQQNCAVYGSSSWNSATEYGNSRHGNLHASNSGYEYRISLCSFCVSEFNVSVLGASQLLGTDLRFPIVADRRRIVAFHFTTTTYIRFNCVSPDLVNGTKQNWCFVMHSNSGHKLLHRFVFLFTEAVSRYGRFGWQRLRRIWFRRTRSSFLHIEMKEAHTCWRLYYLLLRHDAKMHLTRT